MMSIHGRRETVVPGWKSIPCYGCGDAEVDHRLCESSSIIGGSYCHRNNGHLRPERHDCQVGGCRCGQYAGIYDRQPEGVVA